MTNASPSSLKNPVTPERIAALRAEPSFLVAVRQSAEGFVGKYQGSRLLNWLVDDWARLMFGYLALYLHHGRNPSDPSSGLTPTRMKAACAEFEVCSPGRAVAMLQLMRFAGYLAPDPQTTDGRQRRMMATPKLAALVRDRWRVHFEAMAPLMPDGAALLRALDDEAFLGALLRAMHVRFAAGFRFIHFVPALEMFGRRNAGMMILTSLLVQGAPGDSMPPRGPIPLSISALARRFAVSRAHVLKLLRDAAAAGLLERLGPDGDHVVLKQPLTEALQDVYAANFLYLADSARDALDELQRATLHARGVA